MNGYLKFYDLERYLFEEVGPHFRASGTIDPVDFFMILVWKSNMTTRDKLKHQARSFSDAVRRIAAALYATTEPKERLRVLMQDWQLRLPTASAILTVLYPSDFTIYHSRICAQVRVKYRDWTFSDDCWTEYEKYKKAVCANAPGGFSLRNKERYLWAQHLREHAELQVAR